MLVKVLSLQKHLGFVLTACAATLVNGAYFEPVLAADSAAGGASDAPSNTAGLNPDALDSKKIAAAERLYFGSSFEQLSTDQRIDKLERGVFGRNRSGSNNKRFDRITSALGAGKVSASEASSTAPSPAEHAVGKDATAPADATAPNLKPELKPEEKAREMADAQDSKKSATSTQSDTDAPVQALLKAGMTAHRSGQIQMAEGHFKAALALDPRCADAFYNLGSIAESRGDSLLALTNYRAALGINPLDRELQNAVKSVEDDVAKSRATTSSVGKNQPAKTASTNPKFNSAMPKPAPPYSHANNYQGSSSAGYTASDGYMPTSADAKLFNLQTAQNNALMQTQGAYPPLANGTQPAIPVYNVSQQTAPALNVNQSKPPAHSSSGMSSLVNVLMMSTPLHCPICRLKQMGNW